MGQNSDHYQQLEKRVLYKNSNDKYKKHHYVMQFIYIACVSLMAAACKTRIKSGIKFNSISKGQLLSLNPKTTTRTQLFLPLKRTLFECVKAFLSQSRNKGYVETLQFHRKFGYHLLTTSNGSSKLTSAWVAIVSVLIHS